ncbi:hypothetical protein EV368DRAFT_88927 [Lentinula lateritia]|nr:hypothetical protein EV368DRAFT_88927 [Lentinula lateritia]
MDKDYDEKEAGRERSVWATKYDPTSGEGWEDSTTIRKFEEPSCWRMAQVDANGVFEVVVHVQGVIEDKKLPPIRGELTKKKMQHIRQSITVSGLGSKAFGGDIDSVFDLYAFFARHIPGLKFDATKGTSERPMLEMSNRIFTPKVEAPNMNPAKVDKQMDENGVIERTNAMDAMFVYGEENIVLYGKEKTDASGHKKTVCISPQKLHVGDIVDIAFSMVAFGKGNKLKARLLLGNITLLDATHTQKWLKQKAKNQFLSVKSQPMLRRRREFDNDEDEEDARKRMRHMDIADTNEMQAES